MWKSWVEKVKVKVPSVKDYLRNHTNIVTVDKKSVSLYLHQDGYNDKDDDVLSFRSSWDIFAKFDLLEIIVNCLLMMMMMVMVMMIKMVMMIPNPQILLSLKRWCSTTRFVVLLICWFHVMVMVIVRMMPRFVGFLPIKSTNLVVSEEMVQYNKICCFIGYILVIAYICGNIL